MLVHISGAAATPDRVTITLSGPISGQDATDVELAILLARAAHAGPITLQVVDVTIIDAGGLAVLLEAANELVACGGSFPKGLLLGKVREFSQLAHGGGGTAG
jgi:ABC-type transporter Mla MlaB component